MQAFSLANHYTADGIYSSLFEVDANACEVSQAVTPQQQLQQKRSNQSVEGVNDGRSPSPGCKRTGKRRRLRVAHDSDSEEGPACSSSAAPTVQPVQTVQAVQPVQQAEVTPLWSSRAADGRLASLVDMGFLPGQARKALEATNGNFTDAIDLVLSGSAMGTDAPVRAVAQRTPVVTTRQNGPPRTRQSEGRRKVPVQPKLLQRRGKRSRKPTHADVDAGDSASESNCDSSGMSDADFGDRPKKPTGGARALADMSSAAQLAIMDALAGPVVEGATGSRQRRVDVRQTIKKGCLNLKTDFWGEATADLVAQSPSFGMCKEHQRVAVRWFLALSKCVPGMILADEMGLGKTLSALCFLDIINSSKPTLIVAPASLLGNWEAEAKRWTPRLTVYKYHAGSDATPKEQLQDAYFQRASEIKLIITTPNALHCKEDQQHFFKRISFECLVVDEAHGMKNSKTAKYHDLLSACRCQRRLLLTGTPIQNSLAELATLLGFALSERGGDRVSAQLQSISEEPRAQALRQLQAFAGPLILRRLKTDVLTELPAKRGEVVYCDMAGTQRTHYDQEIANGRMARRTAATVKDAFFALRRICLHPLLGKHRLSEEQIGRFIQALIAARPDFRAAPRAKVEAEVRSWSDFDKHCAALEHGLAHEFRVTKEELLGSSKVTELLKVLRQQAITGSKTLVFSQFTQLLDIVQAALTSVGIRYVRLDGTTAIGDRQGMVGTFQAAGGPLVFLISTKAGGVGLNLTAANVVVMLDLDFNPQNTRQAEDRVHRLGQTRDVTVYYLVCRDTVEQMVLKRNLAKMQLDMQFGAKQAVLQHAAAGIGCIADGAVDGIDEGDSDDGKEDASSEAKACEKDVFAEVRRLLSE